MSNVRAVNGNKTWYVHVHRACNTAVMFVVLALSWLSGCTWFILFATHYDYHEPGGRWVSTFDVFLSFSLDQL